MFAVAALVTGSPALLGCSTVDPVLSPEQMEHGVTPPLSRDLSRPIPRLPADGQDQLRTEADAEQQPPAELIEFAAQRGRRLLAGDAVEIDFLGAPEHSGEQIIRRDGRISLPLVGDVQAAGKTPTELRRELRELYRPQLQQAEISVVVRSPDRLYISGQVRRPGIIDMPRPLTVLEAIMEAGGFEERLAEVRTVVVIRRRAGQYFGTAVNLKPALNGMATQALYLEPYDMVYVPRTGIAKANQWVEQWITRMIPRLGILTYRGGEIGASF